MANSCNLYISGTKEQKERRERERENETSIKRKRRETLLRETLSRCVAARATRLVSLSGSVHRVFDASLAR